ncbi:hypothetical protein [[Clostridium] hylemonae]|uniref:Uncharacterized protein n=1 Tax=[Clostridium] hylemonae DSM 15053 TaxID=553973 RepID=C0C6B1_9FIRM|nr:hypothetical protein [[Clostridium] hylemonae]EEG72246.1 hypothetical protein CLOHYLEM_07648 [[Clostridium] hylemonae DSM 15053]QEK16803.1 hypothetical protein LAJLEIBI_00805 [[Clostridium] hylemonae DSM 15053]
MGEMDKYCEEYEERRRELELKLAETEEELKKMEYCREEARHRHRDIFALLGRIVSEGNGDEFSRRIESRAEKVRRCADAAGAQMDEQVYTLRKECRRLKESIEIYELEYVKAAGDGENNEDS